MIASPSIAFNDFSGSAITAGGSIMTTPPALTGVAAPAAAFTSLQTPVATAINIKADYDAKNGTPTAGNPDA